MSEIKYYCFYSKDQVDIHNFGDADTFVLKYDYDAAKLALESANAEIERLKEVMNLSEKYWVDKEIKMIGIYEDDNKKIDILESENKKLTDMIHELTSKLKMAEIENSILKINGTAARNKDGI